MGQWTTRYTSAQAHVDHRLRRRRDRSRSGALRGAIRIRQAFGAPRPSEESAGDLRGKVVDSRGSQTRNAGGAVGSEAIHRYRTGREAQNFLLAAPGYTP